MRGRIYENKSGKGGAWIVKFPGVYRRFSDYGAAERFLTGLRFKSDEGIFDPRDYRRDNPLSLGNQISQWLEKKKLENLKCPRNLDLHTDKVIEFFGKDCNVKSVGDREADQFRSWLLANPSWSSKYKSDILITFKSFLKWFARMERKSGYTAPEVEPIEFEMAMRPLLSKERQMAVLDEIRRITWDKEPKIYLACLWMATYVTARPKEILSVTEADVDLKAGIVWIRNNKERKNDKRLYLLDEDIEWLKTLPTVLHPEKVPFFRHSKPRNGMWKKNVGKPFGKRLIYKWWIRAMDNLGIPRVPLYSGTRHSSASALGEHYTPEEIMIDGTGHSTSKSFLRYFNTRVEKKRAVANTARTGVKPGETKVKPIKATDYIPNSLK